MSLNWERFVVAEASDGAVVACGQIKPHRDGSQELASLTVTEAWRGRGLARAIIEHLVAGHEGELYLMCVERLGPFYEKFGFVAIKDLKDMPRYFRLASAVVGVAAPIIQHGQHLLIMKLAR